MDISKGKKIRIIALVGAPLVVVFLLAGIFSLFGSKTNAATATPTVIAVAPEDDSVTPTVDKPVTSGKVEPTPAAIAPEDVVARVNQRVIPVDLLNVAQATDRAITKLLEQPPSNSPDILEILVNGELVWQQAAQVNYTLSEDQIAAALENFLASQGKVIAELETALTTEGLTLATFQAYYGRLLVINGFSQQQAQAQGVSVESYLTALQRSAQVSFGPAAAIAAAFAVEEDQPVESETAAVLSEADPKPISNDVPRGTNTGQLAPDFDLPAINFAAGDFLSLGDLSGKPVLLSFWTTWCPYCQAQTPILVEAYTRYNELVQFVGINVREQQDQVQSYVNTNLMPYPVLLDVSGQIADTYGVSGFPTTYFLDAAGKVVARQIGQLKPDQVDQYMEQLLAAPDT